MIIVAPTLSPDEDREPALLVGLLQVFEEARSRVAAWMSANQISFTARTNEVLIEDNDEGTGWSGRTVEVQRNVLELGHFGFLIRQELHQALGGWGAGVRDLAEGLESRFHETKPPPSPFPPGDFYLLGKDLQCPDRDDPVEMVMAQFVLAPVRWYLEHLESVEVGEPRLASTLADEVLSVMAEGQFIVRQAVALAGLRTTEDLEHDNVRLRRLTPAERGRFLDMRDSPSTLVNALASGYMPITPAHVLEVDSPCRDIRELGTLSPPRILTAMQLHQLPVVGPGMVASQALPEWYGRSVSGRPIVMRQHEEHPNPKVTLAVFESVCATAEKLNGQRLDDPQCASEIALHRFSLGCARDDAADALVDFVVSLEALLLPYGDDQRTEMNYRFRLHGAHFIALHALERSTLFGQLNKLYLIRSRMVHGGTHPSPVEIREATRDAKAIAARGLLKALDEGFPDVAYFRRAVLGESQGE